MSEEIETIIIALPRLQSRHKALAAATVISGIAVPTAARFMVPPV